jgi:pimeloyl-ACP methyl ester carboxylesterase
LSLHTRLVGPGRPNLLFMHGLFGQGRNWAGIAQGLLPEATSLLLDLPDHGHSPWSNHFSYVDMADAVAHDLRERLGSAAALTVAGHSMGGKVAMVLALRHPELVRGLIVVDIAPDDTSHGYGFGHIVNALRSLELGEVTSRDEASEEIADEVPDAAVRDFLLQNLRRKKRGWAWLCNLGLLGNALPQISGWPADVTGRYVGPVLWIRGERSEYVREEHFPAMLSLFPRTALLTVAGAGHWLHSDDPDAVVAGLRDFLLAEGLARPEP